MHKRRMHKNLYVCCCNFRMHTSVIHQNVQGKKHVLYIIQRYMHHRHEERKSYRISIYDAFVCVCRKKERENLPHHSLHGVIVEHRLLPTTGHSFSSMSQSKIAKSAPNELLVLYASLPEELRRKCGCK